MSLDRMLEHEMAFVQARVTSSDPSRRQPMQIIPMAISLAENIGRRLALHLFRLATRILRYAASLYRRGVISLTGLWVALSAANLIQRMDVVD